MPALRYKYGNYAHAVGDVALEVNEAPLTNPRGQVYGRRVTHTLRGKLLGNGQIGTMTSRIVALQRAYSTRVAVAGLFTDTNQPTAHILNASSALGGIRVVKFPSFPSSERAEYINYRSYEIVIEADYLDPAFELVAFEETLSFQGNGGPRIAMYETIRGLPQEETLNEYTICRATQAGFAVGQTRYPEVPAPILGEPIGELSVLSYKSPEMVNGGLTNYRVEWSYSFQSAEPQNGLPNFGV